MSVQMDLLGAARAMSGNVEGGNVAFLGVSTDSRSVAAGELFVALRGERFDGHEFVAAAYERGAAAVVVDAAGAEALRSVAADLPRIVVADTRIALGELAAAWRARFSLPMIGGMRGRK